MVNVGKYTSPMDCLGTHPPLRMLWKKTTPSCLEQFAPHLDRWSGKPNGMWLFWWAKQANLQNLGQEPYFRIQIKFEFLFHGPFGFSVSSKKPKKGGFKPSIKTDDWGRCPSWEGRVNQHLVGPWWILLLGRPFSLWEISELTDPKQSMYGIFTYIYHILPLTTTNCRSIYLTWMVWAWGLSTGLTLPPPGR